MALRNHNPQAFREHLSAPLTCLLFFFIQCWMAHPCQRLPTITSASRSPPPSLTYKDNIYIHIIDIKTYHLLTIMLSHAAEKLGHSIVGAEGFWRLSIDMISIIFVCFAVMQYVLCCIILNDYLEISSTYIQLPRRSLLTVCRKPHPPCRGWQEDDMGDIKNLSKSDYLIEMTTHRPIAASMFLYIADVTPIGQFE